MTDPAEQPERPPLSKIRGVAYVGGSDVRVVTAADLAARGVKADADLTWATPDYLVTTSHLSAAVIDLLLADPDFTVVPTEPEA